jgi:hypothetical protein
MAALAVGFAIPLLWGDESGSGTRRLPAAEVEHRLSGNPLAIPFAPVASRPARSTARCVPSGASAYSCTVRLVGHDELGVVTYELEAPAFETAPRQRVKDLRDGLAIGYRLYCRGTPPLFQVRCNGVRCLYRIGQSGPWTDYRKPPSKSAC